MQESIKDAATEVADLLTRFKLDLGGLAVGQWVGAWLSIYPADWIRLAIVEALYQGRYKAVSVEQILRLWQRRKQPLYHFNPEFERIIRGRFARNLLTQLVTPFSHKTEVPEVEPEVELGVSPEVELELFPEANSEDAPPALSLEDIASEDIEPLNDRLHLLSLEESIAFLKRRSEGHLPEPDGAGAPVQAFQPLAATGAVARMKWLQVDQKLPIEEIHRFIPSLDSSEFYGKLKAVAYASASARGSSD